MKSRISKLLFTFGLAIVAVLTALPSTGWLIRQQLRVVTGRSIPGAETSGSMEWKSLNAREKAVATAHPSDFGLQLAWALRFKDVAAAEAKDAPDSAAADDTQNGEALKGKDLIAILPLRARFGDRPELQADLLRFLCMGDFRINRSDENLLLRPKDLQESIENERKALAEHKQPRTSKAAMALAEDAAKHGETLDPGNAFFPTMLAAAYLAGHKDAEAVDALVRAAAKPEWNDYGTDEARARIALLKAGVGSEPGAFSRAISAAVILFPHFAQIRDEARVMTALAVQHELAGDREGGLRVRQAMARVGAKMRVQPRTIICSLVGAAITAITAARPGGAPYLDLQAENSDARAATRESRYVAYLTQIGHPEEAAWFVAERAAADKMQQISKQSFGESNNYMMPYIVLGACWVAGLFCLISILTMLGIGGVAAYLVRSPRVQSALLLHQGIRCGLILSALAPIGYLGVHFLLGDVGLQSVGYELALTEAVVVGLALFFLKRKRTWREFFRDGTIAAATMAAFCGVAAAAAWLGGRITAPVDIANMMSANQGSNGGSPDPFWNDIATHAILAAIALAIPSIAIVFFAIRSKIRRVPISVGIVRGLRNMAVPASAILLLAYSAICAGTLYEEAVARNEVNHQISDEGPYLASKLGVEWPGAVAVPAADVKSGEK